MGIFSPKDKSYLPYFKSMAQNVLDSAELLTKIVNAKSDEYKKIAEASKAIETNADTVKNEITTWINNSFITPFDRDDMHEISSRIDDVIDGYYRTIDMIYLYNFADLPNKIQKQVKILDIVSTKVFGIISGMSDIKVHSKEFSEIRNLLSDSEKIHRSLLARFFTYSSDFKEILKTKDLIDSLFDISHAFKAVVSIFEQIAIKDL